MVTLIVSFKDMRTEKQHGVDELPAALFDPASVFASPSDVVKQTGLSVQQKAEILRRWEYDASEKAVAIEEGMRGAEDDLLRQILLALDQLNAGVDVEHVGPSKQHGLPCSQ